MYYISNFSDRDGKYGVVDTRDEVVEFYTKKEIKMFLDRGIKIEGAKYLFRTEDEVKGTLAKLVLLGSDILVYYNKLGLVHAECSDRKWERLTKVPHGVDVFTGGVPHFVVRLDLPNSLFTLSARLEYVRTIYLPKSSYIISPEVFYNNFELGVLDLSGAYVIGAQACSNCTSLHRVVLGEDLSHIPYGCFMGCISLRDIRIPNGVVSIDSCAFSGTSIYSVFLPSSVKEICSDSFPSVTDVWLEEHTNIKITEGTRFYKHHYHRYNKYDEASARHEYMRYRRA